ncbi:hypothetical protein [uncultured Arthrobacter sp.]|uniref:hypothetical protein n=1 Tax=uncultured Arthrobacter sp. TaxID=114050 RepID=UPI0028D87FAF|nr:hypothetical protein [uncultured Arthrobacter sp.]
MADVFGYLLRLADVLDVDLEVALRAKINLNAKKYPVELARGNALNTPPWPQNVQRIARHAPTLAKQRKPRRKYVSDNSGSI